jgi:endonuclease III
MIENNTDRLIAALIQRGEKLLAQPYKPIEFTKNPEADAFLNDLRRYPHAYVLACVMDRQIKAERAWIIPHKFSREIRSFSFDRLLELKQEEISEIFGRRKLHRFNERMAEYFYLAIQRIHENYHDNASNIWDDNPRSATVVRRFLEFKGVGVKIATMAANILARDFKISMKDHICIDISPDVHVKRVFRRLGLISEDSSNDELIICAREMNPEYPGIFDLSCWEIGREYCHPNNPDCDHCSLNKYCPKGLRTINRE